LAACAVTALKFAAALPGWVTDAIARGMLFLTTLVICGLFIRTVMGLVRGELRTLSS
jgi:tellurite resistance protein